MRTAHGLGHPLQLHDHVRPRRRAAALGGPPAAPRAASRRTRAGSPSSSRCRSSTRTRRSTWRARRAPGPRSRTICRMHAVARILLDGVIPNVQVSWVKIGVDACQAILRGGANDFGGTLMEETISRMAGAEWGIRMTPAGSTTRSARSAGRPRAPDDLRAHSASSRRPNRQPLDRYRQSALTAQISRPSPCTWRVPVGTMVDDARGPPAKLPRLRLVNGVFFLQNHTRVISGGDKRAPLHPLARASAVSRVRPGDLLPREGRFIEGGQADLLRVSRSDRVPELRAAPRRAVRRVGRHERTGTATPEAHGVLIAIERGYSMAAAKKTTARKKTAARKPAAKKTTARKKTAARKPARKKTAARKPAAGRRRPKPAARAGRKKTTATQDRAARKPRPARRPRPASPPKPPRRRRRASRPQEGRRPQAGRQEGDGSQEDGGAQAPPAGRRAAKRR